MIKISQKEYYLVIGYCDEIEGVVVSNIFSDYEKAQEYLEEHPLCDRTIYTRYLIE